MAVGTGMEKLMKEEHFTDFIDCGQYLVDKQYNLNGGESFAMGGSAGGMLMGASPICALICSGDHRPGSGWTSSAICATRTCR